MKNEFSKPPENGVVHRKLLMPGRLMRLEFSTVEEDDLVRCSLLDYLIQGPGGAMDPITAGASNSDDALAAAFLTYVYKFQGSDFIESFLDWVTDQEEAKVE